MAYHTKKKAGKKKPMKTKMKSVENTNSVHF